MFLTKKHPVKNTHTHKPTHNKHRLTEITDIHTHKHTHPARKRHTDKQTQTPRETDTHTHIQKVKAHQL